MVQESKLLDISIKGISITIDWVSLTIKPDVAPFNWERAFVLPQFLADEKMTKINPKMGYKTAYQWDNGTIVMAHPARPDMGIHIIMNGSTLKKIEDWHGLDGWAIIQWYQGTHVRFSRVDVAVDAFNFGYDAEHYHKAYKLGLCSNKRTPCTFIENNQGKGNTLYIGSMKSRRKMLCIYDKGKQTGRHSDWLRFELRYYGTYADKLCNHFSFENAEYRRQALAAVDGWASFPELDSWKLIFSEDPLTIEADTKTDTNTEKWLIETVSKTLAKVSLSNDRFLGRFMKEYRDWIKIYEGERDAE